MGILRIGEEAVQQAGVMATAKSTAMVFVIIQPSPQLNTHTTEVASSALIPSSDIIVIVDGRYPRCSLCSEIWDRTRAQQSRYVDAFLYHFPDAVFDAAASRRSKSGDDGVLQTLEVQVDRAAQVIDH